MLADINLLNVGGTLSKFVFLCRVCVDLTQTRVKLRVKKRKFVSNRHKYLCLCVFGNAPVCYEYEFKGSPETLVFVFGVCTSFYGTTSTAHFLAIF